LTEDGGVWDLGVIDEAKFAPNQLSWLPILDDTYFLVPIAGGKLLSTYNDPDYPPVVPMSYMKGKPTIFDSGTTLLLGPDQWLASVFAVFTNDYPGLPQLTNLINPQVYFLERMFSCISDQTFESCVGTFFFCFQIGMCVQLSDVQIGQYPTMQFDFTTVENKIASVLVPPQKYILQLNDTVSGIQCHNGIIQTN
jgi:hypothetical protein